MSRPVFGTWWAHKYLLNERMRANSCGVVTGAIAEIGRLEREVFLQKDEFCLGSSCLL